jgi:Fe-S-cluster containining protein
MFHAVDETFPLGEHDLDDAGEHDDDVCQPCLERHHTVENRCRCGECCKGLIVEATARDAARQPLIKVLGKKMRSHLTGDYPPDDEAEWMLNGPGGACVFYREEGDTGLCGIHATRPLVCRLFCCDNDMARVRQAMGEGE